jgi:hypothetical protein
VKVTSTVVLVPQNSELTRSAWRSEKCRRRGSGMCTPVPTKSVYINEKKSYGSLLSSQSTCKSQQHTHHIHIFQSQSYTYTIMSGGPKPTPSQGFGECHVPNCTCQKYVGDGRDPCGTCGHAAGYHVNCKHSTIHLLICTNSEAHLADS